MKFAFAVSPSAIFPGPVLLAASALAHTADTTALALFQEGNRPVGTRAKDKVVQIRSVPSIRGETPTVWYAVSCDPTSPFKSVEEGKVLKTDLHIHRVD